MFGFFKGLYAKLIPANGIEFANGIYYTYGPGSPEGVLTATVGSVYINTSNGEIYRKTSGTGNTGWQASIFAGFANGTQAAPGSYYSSEPDVGWWFDNPEVTFVANNLPLFAINKGSGQIRAAVNSQIGTDYSALYNAYLPRAWANFNGVPISGTYSRTGTTVTISITGHGLESGMAARLDFTSGTATDGFYFVAVIDANTFTVTDSVSGSTSGNVAANVRVRSAGNISNVVRNSAGDYTIAFNDAMPDAYYSAVVSTALAATGSGGSQRSNNYVNDYLTSSVHILTSNDGGFTDMPIVSLMVTR